MSCFINGSLVTAVLPLSGCWTFLKANDSPGLQTSFVDLWTCAVCWRSTQWSILVYMHWINMFCCRRCCSWYGGCGGPERNCNFWCCGHRTGHHIGHLTGINHFVHGTGVVLVLYVLHSWCRGCGGPERSFSFWHYGHGTGTVWLFVFPGCCSVSGRHWLYHLLYCEMYHSQSCLYSFYCN